MKLNVFAVMFMGTLLLMSGLIWVASTYGSLLPTVDEQSDLSLRDVSNRRNHYMLYNSFGK